MNAPIPERPGPALLGPGPAEGVGLADPRRVSAPPPLALWGGIECTVNRVGDRYLDQLERSGHAARPGDLDLIASLGLRTLRYPALWERTAPDGLASADWAWTDERMGQLRCLGIAPIVGFVHHGSGPRETSLLDPAFPEKLAAYARAFAERYPWVDAYTPVNEPLTTARFSALYGHWYPHARDDASFVRALLVQCRAVALAMQAVRKVNPSARLVQTEDLGRTWSTPALAYQADFENERRWLTWDLLAGRVDRAHPLWAYLVGAGADPRELDALADRPCPPDLVGVNHYVTSERFLDERIEHYPPFAHGSNGQHPYADVAAVRVLGEGPAGLAALLGEAWARYKRPLAVTEVHLGGPSDEQVRWLVEAWDAALRASEAGADVRALTVWALLGSYDWPSLVTRDEGLYEAGCFDVCGGAPCPTPLAEAVRALASGARPKSDVLTAPGWWKRPERLLYPPYPSLPEPSPARVPEEEVEMEELAA